MSEITYTFVPKNTVIEDYSETEWSCGDTISATKLNKIEDRLSFVGGGIYLVGTTFDVSNQRFVFDKTWREIIDALEAHKKVFVCYQVELWSNTEVTELQGKAYGMMPIDTFMYTDATIIINNDNDYTYSYTSLDEYGYVLS